jgi:hypothetical protein
MSTPENNARSRAEALTKLTDETVRSMIEYVDSYKGLIDGDILLKNDLRSVVTQLDNVILTWIIQHEYSKMRTNEIKMATEIARGQLPSLQTTEEEVIRRAASQPKEVKQLWSIDDDDDDKGFGWK